MKVVNIRGIDNIRRYVNHFTEKRDARGKRAKIDVKFERIANGAIWPVAWAAVGSNKMGVCVNHQNRVILWHEMGHLHAANDGSSSETNEVRAQLWALRKAHRLGYTRLYRELLQFTYGWLKLNSKHPSHYGRAAKRILKTLERERMPTF